MRYQLSPTPMRVDTVYPWVCIDKDFNYPNDGKPTTKLRAIRDAETAFRYSRSGVYHCPPHFQQGIDKISAIVGQPVTGSNVIKLRKEIEHTLGDQPQRPSIVHRIKEAVVQLLDL